MANSYNFDEIIDRRSTDSVKWDLSTDRDVLPMWVADMDFKTAPEITEAIIRKMELGIYGYNLIPADFFDSIIHWWKEVHHFEIKKEWILPGPGMIPSLSAILRTFVKPGENIIIQPPVYNHFYDLLENCRFGLVENNLMIKDGRFQIDFDDLEAKASNPETTLLLLCNPHNPVGRAWKKDELERIAAVCSENGVMVLSDEIHADLVYEGHQHFSFADIARDYNLKYMSCCSPCKTFNLAGLPISYMISQDQQLLAAVHKTMVIQETSYPNPVAGEALMAAYRNGGKWLHELKDYLYQNYQYLVDFAEQYLPEIVITPLEATYLVWLDCRKINKTSQELSQILLEQEKLWVNPGTMYGQAGEGFLRINIGCPRETLEEGLGRFRNFYRKAFQ
ncbi:MAG: pyridoxal phosphate-dependent aminotransferase [Chryseobacterium sp.]|nr:MAG: pyridoxal phosphate-dependent aminotransferase [Chryseobacterium sp.]